MFPCLTYTASIFDASGSNLAPNSATIIVGVFQLFGNYIATVFVDRVGRKVIMMTELGCL